MKHKIIFVCLFFIAIFISCKKDEPQPDGTIKVTPSSLLLGKVLTDNQPTFEYTYNSANLISEEKSKFNITMNHYNEKNLLISTDYYSNYDILSSDLMIYQTAMNKVEWVTPDNPNKGGSINYEYNSKDQLTKAIYTPASGSSQYSEFTYDGNSRINRQVLYFADTQTGYIDYSYDDKGNLVKEMVYNLSAAGTPELSTTTEYEFDNQQNPYRSISRLMTPGINTNLNNIVKETYTISMQDEKGADSVEVTETSYEYNDKGFPVSKNGNIAYVYGE